MLPTSCNARLPYPEEMPHTAAPLSCDVCSISQETVHGLSCDVCSGHPVGTLHVHGAVDPAFEADEIAGLNGTLVERLGELVPRASTRPRSDSLQELLVANLDAIAAYLYVAAHNAAAILVSKEPSSAH